MTVTASTLMALRLTLWRVAFAFLGISILSASFYDPTLLSQIYIPGRVENWLGVLGALTGGTLVELLGPSALLISWFGIRLCSKTKKRFRWTIWYYPAILVLALSTAQALWLPSLVFYDNPHFFAHPGYLGLLTQELLLSWFDLPITSIFVAFVLLMSCAKTYHDLPIKLFSLGSALLFLLPFHGLQQVRERLVPYVVGWLRLKHHVLLRKWGEWRKKRSPATTQDSTDEGFHDNLDTSDV